MLTKQTVGAMQEKAAKAPQKASQTIQKKAARKGKASKTVVDELTLTPLNNTAMATLVTILAEGEGRFLDLDSIKGGGPCSRGNQQQHCETRY